MCKKLIIIAGYVAGGKTTFSLKLSKELSIPCFNKDLIKIDTTDFEKVNFANYIKVSHDFIYKNG
jgi:adenylate kinase family enzyme